METRGGLISPVLYGVSGSGSTGNPIAVAHRGFCDHAEGRSVPHRSWLPPVGRPAAGTGEDVSGLKTVLRSRLMIHAGPRRVHGDRGLPFASSRLLRACALVGVRRDRGEVTRCRRPPLVGLAILRRPQRTVPLYGDQYEGTQPGSAARSSGWSTGPTYPGSRSGTDTDRSESRCGSRDRPPDTPADHA